MRSTRVAWTLALLGLAGAVAAEAGDWLPPPVEQGASEQLAGRLEGAGLSLGDSASAAESARVVIASLRETLESWGEQGVLERAPEFAGLGLPEAGDRRLDAMARYHVCNMVMALQLQDPALADDGEARAAAILGLSAITLAVVYLREPFQAAGGDDEAIESHLAGAGMEPVLARLQEDEAARHDAQAQCRTILAALLEKPLQRLGSFVRPAE